VAVVAKGNKYWDCLPCTYRHEDHEELNFSRPEMEMQVPIRANQWH